MQTTVASTATPRMSPVCSTPLDALHFLQFCFATPPPLLLCQIGALRALAAEKDSGLELAREENARLKGGVGLYQKEVERLTSENRILKRAVGIQNTKGKEVRTG